MELQYTLALLQLPKQFFHLRLFGWIICNHIKNLLPGQKEKQAIIADLEAQLEAQNIDYQAYWDLIV